ncbi:MAG: hypothetical protein R2725_06120 [Solirubrobacterales bacterium]
MSPETDTESAFSAPPAWSAARSSACCASAVSGSGDRSFASARSAGREIEFDTKVMKVRGLSEDSIQGIDVLLSSAGGSVSAEWVPKFVAAGATVVDNTSHFRMHDEVPLVVAEVNPRRSRATPGSSPTRTARPCRWSSP